MKTTFSSTPTRATRRAPESASDQLLQRTNGARAERRSLFFLLFTPNQHHGDNRKHNPGELALFAGKNLTRWFQ